MQPLTSIHVRTEALLLTKVEVWWYLVVKLGPNLSCNFDQVKPSSASLTSQLGLFFFFLSYFFQKLKEAPVQSLKKYLLNVILLDVSKSLCKLHVLSS